MSYTVMTQTQDTNTHSANVIPAMSVFKSGKVAENSVLGLLLAGFTNANCCPPGPLEAC